ncbi:MAG: TonB-dependent receptor [Saprospiraceae bacterium]|nr:TonB-dependent receptor [Saprospiraceae bacterium]
MADYSLTDMDISYPIIKNLTATLRVENIFDIKYNEIYGYSTRGRGIYLTLRYNKSSFPHI